MYLAPHIALSGTVEYIPEGMPGVYETLRKMRKLADAGAKNLAIRSAAANIVFLTPERDELSEVVALFDFVRTNIRYTKDISEVETLSAPEKTLAVRYGDCDDQTTLLAALFQSVGYPTRFVIAGYQDPKIAEHVYLQVFVGGQWVDCDPTEQAMGIGWAPPNPVFLYHEGD